jgi:predicted CoA-binding protein
MIVTLKEKGCISKEIRFNEVKDIDSYGNIISISVKENRKRISYYTTKFFKKSEYEIVEVSDETNT